MKERIFLLLILIISLFSLSPVNSEVPVGGTVSYTLNVSGFTLGNPYIYNTTNFHFSIKSTNQNATMTEFQYTSANDTYFYTAFGSGLNLQNNTFYINSTGMVPGASYPPTIPFYTPANYTLYQNYTSGYYFDIGYFPIYYNVTSLNYPYRLNVDGTTQTVEAWKLALDNMTVTYQSVDYYFYNSSLLYAKNTSTLLSWNFQYMQIQSGTINFQVNVSLLANQASNIPFVIDYPTSSSSTTSSLFSSSSSTSTISLAGFELLPVILGAFLLAKRYRKHI